MLREVDLKDISDGRLYELNDMVKADCMDCKGCHKCCTDMGDSIVLDPYDMMLIRKATGKSFNDLMENEISLSMFDGVILPHINMSTGKCSFLDENGRCSIHSKRPGICRLFPLGRYYFDNEEEGFKYFLQTKECPAKKAKIKVNKWIDTAAVKENQRFINRWHFFIKKAGEKVKESDTEKSKEIAMAILSLYGMDWVHNEDNFYTLFEMVLTEIEKKQGF